MGKNNGLMWTTYTEPTREALKRCTDHIVKRQGLLLSWNTTECMSCSRSLNVSRALVLDPQGSPLAAQAGSPVSFAAVGSFAMGAAGTALVYVRCDVSIP